MKKSYFSEMTSFILSGLAGILIWNLKWYVGLPLGVFLFVLNSIVVISNLKRETIEEYLEFKQKLTGKEEKWINKN